MHPAVQARLDRTLGQAAQRHRAPVVRGFGAFLWDKRWFFIALAIGAVLMSFSPPEGLDRRGLILIAMSVVAIILFVTEPVPLPTVAPDDHSRSDRASRNRFDFRGRKPDERFRPVHHGIADAGGRGRQAKAGQADRLLDRPHDRHRHGKRLRRHFDRFGNSRLFHRRTHRGRDDAARRHHAHNADFGRFAESARALPRCCSFRFPTDARSPESGRRPAAPATRS